MGGPQPQPLLSPISSRLPQVVASTWYLLDDKTTMRSESLDTTLPIVPTDSTTNNNNDLLLNDNTVNTLSL